MDVETFLNAFLARYDTNKDGKISEEEFEPFLMELAYEVMMRFIPHHP